MKSCRHLISVVAQYKHLGCSSGKVPKEKLRDSGNSRISGNSRNTFFRIRSLMVSRSSGLFQLRTGDAPGFLPWSRFGHFHNFQRTSFSGSVCLSGQNVSITLNCLTLARKYKEVRVSQYCVPWVLHNICNHCNGWPKTAAGGSFLGGGGEGGHLGPRKDCCHHLQPVISTNQRSGMMRMMRILTNQGAATIHRFPGDHKLYNF